MIDFTKSPQEIADDIEKMFELVVKFTSVEVLDRPNDNTINLKKAKAITYSTQCAIKAAELHISQINSMKLIFSDRELHLKKWNEILTILKSKI